MVETRQTPGSIQRLGSVAGGEMALLHSFAVDEAHLGHAHRRWLRETFRSASRPAGTTVHVWVMGLASRSASVRHNLALSRRRAASVVDELRSELGDKVRQSPLSFSVGELVAGLRGVPDGLESADDRAVLIGWWQTPSNAPPPPPPPRPRLDPSKTAISIWSIQLRELKIDRAESIAKGVLPQFSTNHIRARFRIKREPHVATFNYVLDIDDGFKMDAPGFGPTTGSIREGNPEFFEKHIGKEYPPSKWIAFTYGFGEAGTRNPIDHDMRCMFRTKDTLGNVELRFGGPMSEPLWERGSRSTLLRPAIRFRYSAEFDYTPSGLLSEEFFPGRLVQRT